MHEFYEALNRFRLMLWLSVPLLLGLATAGGYWIRLRALKPVDRITAAADSISIRNLSGRLELPNTGDELQRLSETLNRMLTRLNDSVQRMSQFTADASHELRAPFLIRTTAGGSKLAAVDRIPRGYGPNSDGSRTHHHLIDTCCYSPADVGRTCTEPTDVHPLREALRQRGVWRRRNGLTADLHSEPVTVYGDAEALHDYFLYH
jgi:HAMP domain-containing protein